MIIGTTLLPRLIGTENYPPIHLPHHTDKRAKNGNNIFGQMAGVRGILRYELGDVRVYVRKAKLHTIDEQAVHRFNDHSHMVDSRNVQTSIEFGRKQVIQKTIQKTSPIIQLSAWVR